MYDQDVTGKEPLVRLLAHRAIDAAWLAVEIAKRLGDSCPVYNDVFKQLVTLHPLIFQAQMKYLQPLNFYFIDYIMNLLHPTPVQHFI